MASKKRISLLNLSLPASPTVPNDENFVEFNRLYGAVKLLTAVLDSMQAAVPATASEDIPFGRFVNFHDLGGGSLGARLADSTTGKPAHAFCLTEGILAGDSTEFICQGLHPAFAGLTPGTRYFLATNGQISLSPPASPLIQQAIGFALSDKSLWVQNPINYLGA